MDMDSSRKSNKIRDIVRLQQILKKWKKLAHNNNNNKSNCPPPSSTGSSTSNNNNSSSSSRSIRFLKKTLSFSDISSSSSALSNVVPKGYVAVCVGKEQKRFVIPTEYLSHQVFGILLREAEEEFGFQQEGVLKFPCEVDLFEKILKMMEDKRSLSSSSLLLLHDDDAHDNDNDHDKYDQFGRLVLGDHACANNYSPDSTDHQLTPPHHHPQMCR